MTTTDPIADMLTRIRNATMAKHELVLIPCSKMKLAIVKILKAEGFVDNYEVLRDKPGRTIKIGLKYTAKKQPAIVGLRRISKPSLRVYVQRAEIPRVYGGLGIAILSTPKGVMIGQQAWKQRLGGELLCYVW
jgi:small subunit ribosomal protein S8